MKTPWIRNGAIAINSGGVILCEECPTCDNVGATCACCTGLENINGFMFTFSGLFGHVDDDCDDCSLLNDTWLIPVANQCSEDCSYASDPIDHCPSVAGPGEFAFWVVTFTRTGSDCDIWLTLAFGTVANPACSIGNLIQFKTSVTGDMPCGPPWTMPCIHTEAPFCFRSADGQTLETAPATEVILDVY